MFPKSFYHFLANNTLIEIKSGSNRHTYTQIWMITTDNRVFARSWNKSQKSWFTAFQENGSGHIKFDNTIMSARGQMVLYDDPIHTKINMAYLAKYNQPHNLEYARGIIQAEYIHYTMEFLPL